MNERLHTDRVLIVEGKYDAARLARLTDAMILLTDGFGIYSDKKRQQLFKALAKKNGLILLTDSDVAGFRIRNYITNLVGAEHVVQAYVPAIQPPVLMRSLPDPAGLQVEALVVGLPHGEGLSGQDPVVDHGGEQLPLPHAG